MSGQRAGGNDNSVRLRGCNETTATQPVQRPVNLTLKRATSLGAHDGVHPLHTCSASELSFKGCVGQDADTGGDDVRCGKVCPVGERVLKDGELRCGTQCVRGIRVSGAESLVSDAVVLLQECWDLSHCAAA